LFERLLLVLISYLSVVLVPALTSIVMRHRAFCGVYFDYLICRLLNGWDQLSHVQYITSKSCVLCTTYV